MGGSSEHIVILTGAGISAESGIDTFRDPGGIWEQYDIEDVATPGGFARNPERVYEFYNMRRGKLRDVEPNAAHEALARLEREYPGTVTLITQNIDNLHERAGSKNLIHMHGEMMKARCTACGAASPWDDALDAASACPSCAISGRMRPHVVWFGEMPLEMDRIYGALSACDLFLSIGTSGSVYPAAGFVAEVHGRAHTVELNLEPSEAQSLFDEKRYGRAGEIVPAYVEELLT